MKFFETKILCMKENEITANIAEGFPSNIYPNSGINCYHDFFEFEYFTEGSGTHYINGIPYTVRKSYAYLLFPGESHHKTLDEEAHFKLFNLKLDVKVPDKKLISDLREYKSPLCVYFNNQDSEFIENEFRLLINILDNKLYNRRMAESCGNRILNIFLCSLEKEGRAGINIESEPIWEIIKYTENNFNKDISLREIAELSGISESYVGAYFKKHTGINFTDHLNKTRLFHALKLLKETNMSIKEISFESGFNSPEYFTRVFTSAFSKSPREYKKDKH